MTEPKQWSKQTIKERVASCLKYYRKQAEEWNQSLTHETYLKDRLAYEHARELSNIAELLQSILDEPKHEWVGLTDQEIDAAVKSCNTVDTYKYFRAIEAKLKEKNT